MGLFRVFLAGSIALAPTAPINAAAGLTFVRLTKMIPSTPTDGAQDPMLC